MNYLSDFEQVLLKAGVDFSRNKIIDDYFLTGKVGVVRDTYKCCQEDTAATMVKLAELEEQDRILEPEAGKGCILKKIAHFPNHHYCEINENFMSYLMEVSNNFVGSDFLQHYDHYDKIIMNPPFSFGQYKDHILHAYDLVNSGGILIALYPKNAEYLEVVNEQFIELLQIGQKFQAGKVCGECECVILKIVKP